jgi:hypothetical protein
VDEPPWMNPRDPVHFDLTPFRPPGILRVSRARWPAVCEAADARNARQGKGSPERAEIALEQGSWKGCHPRGVDKPTLGA